jgi:hypothetical protein
LYNEKLFKLVDNVGDGLCLFYSVSSFLKELHSQENSTFPVEWLPYINMTDSKTFSGSKIIQDLAEFLCTIGEADLDVLKECYGEYYSDDENDIEDDIEKEDKVLPLKYASFVDRVRLKTEDSKNKGIVKWMNNFIFKMIKATKTKDGSWPGEAHALVLSKMLRVRIVIVQNNYNGFKGWFDSDNWIFEEVHPGLTETMSRKAPNRQKTCSLLQTNSKIPYFMFDWQNNFNHFVNLQKILEGFYTDDQKQSAYKGRGSTNNDHCHPLQIDSWEYLLKNHSSTNDDSLGTEGIDSESDKANANHRFQQQRWWYWNLYKAKCRSQSGCNGK